MRRHHDGHADVRFHSFLEQSVRLENGNKEQVENEPVSLAILIDWCHWLSGTDWPHDCSV